MTELEGMVLILQEYGGIFLLMLGAFLIGYIAAWRFNKSRYKEIIRKFRKQEKNHLASRDVHDIETIFTEIKPKIVAVVKEAQKERELQQNEEKIAERTRTNYITYTRTKPELNFDNFGYAHASERQDLTRINGIGPYIEQKLNEIGIYTFEQISRFNEEDIRTITELIDFFPGRIERDNWVGQAKALKVY